MLYVVCCMLYVVCCMLYVVCCMLYVVCCMLYNLTYNLQPKTYNLSGNPPRGIPFHKFLHFIYGHQVKITVDGMFQA
jgi:hypothetical protein